MNELDKPLSCMVVSISAVRGKKTRAEMLQQHLAAARQAAQRFLDESEWLARDGHLGELYWISRNLKIGAQNVAWCAEIASGAGGRAQIKSAKRGKRWS